MANPQIRNITVFTDASFCHETKAGGGAFWARGDVARAQASFPIEGAVHSSDAEVIAACEAILRLAADPVIGKELEKGPETRLVLVTDCQTVQRALNQGRLATTSKDTKKVFAEVEALVKRWKFLLKVNHVKAHKGTATPRQWVNQWCDDQAGAHMLTLRTARRRLLNEQKRAAQAAQTAKAQPAS